MGNFWTWSLYDKRLDLTGRTPRELFYILYKMLFSYLLLNINSINLNVSAYSEFMINTYISIRKKSWQKNIK